MTLSTKDPTASRAQSAEPMIDVDVLIVGAGLSGIGAACRLHTDAPGTSYAILESRAVTGGTWDLFRYPGVRSDSDMSTLGYPFRPWSAPEAIASGKDILAYVRATATEYGVDGHIRFQQRVDAASWSTQAARWTVTVTDTETDTQTTATCRLLYLCSGYYSYESGYTPDWAGLDQFGGQVIHPQDWPKDLDVTGKRVVVVGSGATAVTLVPAMVEAGAGHVSMLQRSPSYVLAIATRDPLDDLLRKRLSPQRAVRAIRWKNIKVSTAIYQLSQRYPERVKGFLRKGAAKQLPVGYDLDTHFSPKYNPWDQRMCLVPEGDLFTAIGSQKADVVTDHIESFTRDGIQLRSGSTLDADIVVAATGLNLRPLGCIALTVDGEKVSIPDRVTYKGMMLDGVPNLAFAVGYTNASWTLKVDLVSTYVAGLARKLSETNSAIVTPRLPQDEQAVAPLIEMTSGYFERSRDALPKQGSKAPWRLSDRYSKDAKLFRGKHALDQLEFTATQSQ